MFVLSPLGVIDMKISRQRTTAWARLQIRASDNSIKGEACWSQFKQLLRRLLSIDEILVFEDGIWLFLRELNDFLVANVSLRIPSPPTDP